MIGIDLFAGAGGLSLGADQAGVDVRLAVEADPHPAATYAANHPRTNVFRGDIRRITKAWLPRGRRGSILFGGPPCQGFSTSNQRTRTLSNPNNWLFKEFIRIARLWRPDWVVLENVRGLGETEGGVFLDHILQSMRDIAYTVSCWVLNAADYGVPQKRFRLFVVGSRDGIELEPPPPTTPAGRHVTVRQAIHDLPELPNGYLVSRMAYRCRPRSDYARVMRHALAESENHLVTRNSPDILRRYRHVPQGGNWEAIPARLMANYADRSRCHTGIYHRLREDEPSIVIGNYRKNMLIHPTQDRGLSVREAARLQSFPDDYVFRGSIGFQQQQVGNAVPPLLAKAVFSHIRAVTGDAHGAIA
jgi:DNA (cytosine-5)-methyltransferase 1